MAHLYLTAPAAGTINGLTLLAFSALVIIPAFFVHAGRRGASRANFGCLGFFVTLAFLWAAATVFAYPAMVLVTLGTPELAQHPEAWAYTAASPLVALGIAWWFGPHFPRPGAGQLFRRTGALLAAAVASVLLALAVGLPITSMLGVAIAVALGAALLCIATWQFMDRLGPAQLLVRAVILLLICIVIGTIARANGVPVIKSPRDSSGAALWTTLLLTGLLLLAGCLLCIAAGRLLGWLKPRRQDSYVGVDDRLPKPREIWNAEVPFREDENESKDRPVLVLRTYGDYADILPITSQDKSRFDNYLFLPVTKWRGVLAKDSWLELKTVPLSYSYFRTLRGRCRSDVWRDVNSHSLPQREQQDAASEPSSS